jgi:hypothetical protein
MRIRFLAAAASIVMTMGATVLAQLTSDEALGRTYPGATIRAEEIFLTPQQQKEVLTQGDADVPFARVARYVATRDGTVIGRAYIDSYFSPAEKERLLILLDGQGQVLRVDVAAISGDFARGGPVRSIATAAVAKRETENAVRRVVAIDAVLQSRGN